MRSTVTSSSWWSGGPIGHKLPELIPEQGSEHIRLGPFSWAPYGTLSEILSRNPNQVLVSWPINCLTAAMVQTDSRFKKSHGPLPWGLPPQDLRFSAVSHPSQHLAADLELVWAALAAFEISTQNTLQAGSSESEGSEIKFHPFFRVLLCPLMMRPSSGVP